MKRMQPYVGDQTCLLTYGDGLANIDIGQLVEFHQAHGKLVTVTAVRPTARFGQLELAGDSVCSFEEKPQLHEGWINGGFFVIEPGFFEFVEGDDTILESSPLETVAKAGELMAFRHEGFWQGVDTKRDRDNLEKAWRSGDVPWQR